jgi:autotransporter-associated beta strand protein
MHDKVKTGWFFSAVLALCFLKPCAASAADAIITPVSASASSGYTGWGEPVSMINGSGLTGIGREATHTNASLQYLFWHSNGQGVSGQWVEFDLGALYDVTNALIWQLAQSGFPTRGVQAFTISVAGDDHVFSTLSTGNTLNIATGQPQEPVQVISLVAKEIRYVKFTIQSNYGNQYVGLSEVRLEGALSVIVPLIVPVGATASSNYGSQPYLYGPQWLIDGSGLTGTGRRATHTNANVSNLFWHSSTSIIVSNQWVEFDLGATYQVTNALVWQLAQQSNINRGIQAFTISVADPDRNFSTVSTNNVLNIATGLANEPAQNVPLVAANVRYVKFNIETNWGASGIVGLSEVRFDGALWEAPAPRELTWNGTSGDAAWNKAAQNWLTNGGATAFATGDHVRFDDTAAEKSVILTNNVFTGAIVVDTIEGYRLSAGTVANNRILSAASFVKRGSGVLEMAGGAIGIVDSHHAFTGGVEIAEGTLATLSGGRELKNATEGLLGNMQAARTIRVNTNATLNLAGRYLSGRLDSIPATALVVDHGTLSLSSTNISETAFGPLTFDSARVDCVNTQANTYVAFNGLTRFIGTSTVAFAQTGYPKQAFFLAPAGTEVCVSNITQDAAWDVRVDWQIKDFSTNNVLVQTSGFRKTGAGTLYLGNENNSLSGDIIVSAGTLELAVGQGLANRAYNVLGNPTVSRKVRVESGATLKFNGSNTIAPGWDSPLEELELVGGTLSLPNNSSSVFGPLTLDDATVTYNTGYSATDWGLMIFSKSVTFKGTQPVVFNPAGANSNFQSGLNEETDMNVWDITGSSAIDVRLNLPFMNFGAVTNKPPSRFKKTGPGTLSLGAINTSTGALRVAEGVLRIDGRWDAVNSSVTAEAGGYLGGTGTVARAVFSGGGFECAAGQAGRLTAGAVSVGATGSVRILNPGGLPITQLRVPFLSYTAIENADNLENWTVEIEGVAPTMNLRVLEKDGKLTAGWFPKGTLLRVL